MKIHIETIPHHMQRYPTVGDWFVDDTGTLQIKVSDMGNKDYEHLVALHELVEVLLCQKRGITTEEVDQFDKQFEKDREAGLHTDDEEAGDDPKAPYRKEHFFATNIEALMSAELGVDWKEYEQTVMNL